MLQTILPLIKDDTEEAPWMIMADPQWQAASSFYYPLAAHCRTHQPPLYVAAMLPIRYRPNPPHPRIEQLAPDVMAAAVPVVSRDSYNVEEEGIAPCFVLEVISNASRRRDTQIKPARYERMGVREYALFRPAGVRRAATLSGYRRDAATDAFVPWEPDGSGRLWSEQVGLWLAIRDGDLHLQRPDGVWLPTYDELDAARTAEQAARDAAEAGWRRELAAREREQAAREQERSARQAAEAEIARLRAELARRQSD